MKIEEIHDKAKIIVNSYFELDNPLRGIIVLNKVSIKTLEEKKLANNKHCIAIEFYNTLDSNLYFMNYLDSPTMDVRDRNTYQESKTYLEIIYEIRDYNGRNDIDAAINFNFMIKDEEIYYQYAAIAQTTRNKHSYSYGLEYIRNSRDDKNTDNTRYHVACRCYGNNHSNISINVSIPFIGIFNNKNLDNINLKYINRYDSNFALAKDYDFSKPAGAFPWILIQGDDQINENTIDNLKIGISHIALSFYKIEKIKNLELTFDSTDNNRENPIFKDYIEYRLRTNYIQDITNIAFSITIWNLELAFSDYQLIKNHKLFTILAFNFNKKYLNAFLIKPYDKLYIKNKTNLYYALLQKATTIEQKVTLHRYVAYYSSRLDKFKSFVFWLTEDYNKISYPLIGIGLSVSIITLINTFNSNLNIISITNINDIFKYRFELSCAGFFTLMFTIISIVITTFFGYLLFALSIAIKRRFGMGNPKDV